MLTYEQSLQLFRANAGRPAAAKQPDYHIHIPALPDPDYLGSMQRLTAHLWESAVRQGYGAVKFFFHGVKRSYLEDFYERMVRLWPTEIRMSRGFTETPYIGAALDGWREIAFRVLEFEIRNTVPHHVLEAATARVGDVSKAARAPESADSPSAEPSSEDLKKAMDVLSVGAGANLRLRLELPPAVADVLLHAVVRDLSYPGSYVDPAVEPALRWIVEQLCPRGILPMPGDGQTNSDKISTLDYQTNGLTYSVGDPVYKVKLVGNRVGYTVDATKYVAAYAARSANDPPTKIGWVSRVPDAANPWLEIDCDWRKYGLPLQQNGCICLDMIPAGKRVVDEKGQTVFVYPVSARKDCGENCLLKDGK